MDIDLNIESLKDYISQLRETIEGFKERRDRFSTRINAMNEVWDAPSYTAFRDEAFFIINGVFLQAIDDAATMRDALASAEEKAVELRKKSNAMIGTLLYGHDRSLGQDNSVLYYDSGQAPTIMSTRLSVESELTSIVEGIGAISSDLLKLKTVSVSVFDEDVTSNADRVVERLQGLDALTAGFDTGLAELEACMSSLSASIDGGRFISSHAYGSLLDGKGLVDPEIALMLFNTPEHLLTEHEKGLLKELKAAGFTQERLIGSQGISLFAGLDMAEGIFKSQFSLGDAAYALVMGEQSGLLKGLGRGIPGFEVAMGLCDAFLTYQTEYDANPQLAESRRISDASMEAALVVGETGALATVDVVLPIIGAAVGTSVGGPVGAAVGGAIGTAAGVGISIAYTLNAEQLQSETIRFRGADGTSWLDDRKDWWYDTWWSQD